MAINASRRNFIKTAGAAAATITAGSFGVASADEAAWDEEFDVVVVGAGIAGHAAAMTVAAEGEGATALLLEKCEAPAGCSPYCGGRCLWTNDAEAMKTYIKDMSQGCTPDDVINAYAEGMTWIPEWIYSFGASEADLTIVQPGVDGVFGAREPEHPECEGSYSIGVLSFGGKGATNPDAPIHIMPWMEDVVAGMSDVVEYRPATPVEKLVKDESGAVVGVIAGDKRIKANKGVIMTLGGFEHNAEMLECYMGVGAAISSAGLGNTGDGILMCQAAGAGFWHMHGGAAFWLNGRSLDNSIAINSDKRFGITVGINGRRFYQDWDACKANIESDGYAYMSDAKGHVGYRHGMTQFGGYWRHLPMPDTAWYVFDADGLAAGAIPADVSEDPVADGIAVCADTIEELAELIDVPVEELSATVAQWNDSCEKGADLAFYRPESTLNPVKTAPFYAQLCAPMMLNTDGGPVRDAKGRILDPWGEPIVGLYSAGEFGSVWGNKYQGCGNVAECIVFGRIAAQTALGL